MSRMQLSSIKEHFRHLRIIERKKGKNNFQKTPDWTMIKKEKKPLPFSLLIPLSGFFLLSFICRNTV